MRDTWAYDYHLVAWVDAATPEHQERIARIAAILVQDRDAMTQGSCHGRRGRERTKRRYRRLYCPFNRPGKRIKDGLADLLGAHIEYESFARLHTIERAAAPRRVDAWKEDEQLEHHERELQARFRDLTITKEGVQARISAKEEQIMMEAEALNEASLAAMEGIQCMFD
ncbi:Pre-mRNA-splicing factor cef1 [Ceratobasidium sp. 395]|nr:Pre-mRNA-splicing factor cef1 [Ceratobasidium sp. 395]